MRHDDRSPASRLGPHRLLPIVAITVVVVAVLAHLGGGAVLARLGGGALVIGLAALITIKLLVVVGARRWWRHR